MRKICLTAAVVLMLGCLVSVSAFADSGFSLRARVTGQFAGNQSFAGPAATINASVNSGFAIGLEGLYKIIPNLQIGAGLEYQITRQATYNGVSQGNFQFLPVYGMVRVPFAFGPIEPYIVGRIGYGIYSGDSTYTVSGLFATNAGLYFGAGAGIDYSLGAFSVFAEATYGLNDGSLSASGVTVNTAYTRLDVSAGVSFAL
ncbi:MAG TPA: outer membrane beta-barrel protein [Spirochaetia bacterium]|nr:outer membrane beta-barrel protein [Spirochaetia bacterium]